MFYKTESGIQFNKHKKYPSSVTSGQKMNYDDYDLTRGALCSANRPQFIVRAQWVARVDNIERVNEPSSPFQI